MEFENFDDIEGLERSCIFEERLDEAEVYRVRGNEFFRNGDLVNAEDCYHKGL